MPLALEAMQTEHEADRTTSLMMDAAEARACIATGDMLSRLVEVLRGLQLDPERMRANLDLGGGLIMAEAVMLDLGQAIGRQHAHDVVYDAAMAAAVEGKSFGDLLAADPRVTAHLDAAAIEALLDPTAYTGLCAEMARDAAARARTCGRGDFRRLSGSSERVTDTVVPGVCRGPTPSATTDAEKDVGRRLSPGRRVQDMTGSSNTYKAAFSRTGGRPARR